jgi:O-antigen/teichoic acid export membrane protein
MPFQQVLIGVSLIALPAFARLHAGGQAVRAARMTRVAMLGAGLGGALFGLVLLVVGPSVFTLIYGARHAQEAPLILYGLGLPMMWSLIAVARVDLRARQNVRLIFFGYAAGGLLAGIPIVPLALPYATAGALIGMTAMFAAVAATLTWLMWKEKSS